MYRFAYKISKDPTLGRPIASALRCFVPPIIAQDLHRSARIGLTPLVLIKKRFDAEQIVLSVTRQPRKL